MLLIPEKEFDVSEENLSRREIRNRVLEFVTQSSYRPLKPKAIAKKIGLPTDQARDMRQVVKRMVIDGELAYGDKHLVRPGPNAPVAIGENGGEAGPVEEEGDRRKKSAKRKQRASSETSPKPGSSGNWIIGTFRRTSKGYGFVRRHHPPGSLSEQDGGDIYIPGALAGDTASGDVVAVEITSPGKEKGKGPRGKIVKVLERETNQFVGTYFEEGNWGYVRIDGNLFSEPVMVGDPTAVDANIDDKVVIEMVRFPTHRRPGEAVVVEVLGERGKPGVDTLLIMRQYGLPERFPEDALRAARDQAHAFEEGVPRERRDATEELTVTIDPADARDFDDAISLSQMENGHWLLGVHIADVAHFVRKRSTLDREAKARSTSVYLPDRVIPMLPEVISNALASLQPGKIRLAKSVYMEFTPTGIRTHTDIYRSAIRSDARLTYDQVGEFLKDPEPLTQEYGKEVADLLDRMHTLAMILRERRTERGALNLDIPEVKIDLDDQGKVCGAHLRQHTVEHQIIEEFMLSANEAVAEYLRDRELYFLRRVHKPPTLGKLKLFSQFVESLEIRGLDTTQLQSRFEIQKLLNEIEGRPEETAIQFFLLRSFQQAIYSPEPEGHFALASDCYCHFTSPIRRYPDLTVHRLLDQLIKGRKPKNDYDELLLLGEHCSTRERHAEDAERELIKLKLLDYMRHHLGKPMDAVVTGIENFGLFVQGKEIPAEGLIRIESLRDDYYRFDRKTLTLTGYHQGNTFRLGDRLRVYAERVDMNRREIDFMLVGRAEETDADSGPEVPKEWWEEPPAPGEINPPKRKRRAKKKKGPLGGKKGKHSSGKKKQQGKRKSSSAKAKGKRKKGSRKKR